MARLRLGTRASDLARWQAEHVADRLQSAGYAVELVLLTTTGDRILDIPLAQIGDKGLFTKELDEALLDGRIDLAVHSLKDLPTRLPEGLTLAAVTARADVTDAFVAHPAFAGGLEDLPDGAEIATSSLRRQAQLLAWRPDLRIVNVRGNVPTRLAKLAASPWHGMILASAGLDRLGLAAHIRTRIPATRMLSAVGQGALGIVCASGRPAVVSLLDGVLTDPDTRESTTAERALLRTLEGGCQIPVAALGRVAGGVLHLEAAVASLDGRTVLRRARTGAVGDAEAVGVALAHDLLADGAAAVLAAIRTPASRP